MNRVSEMPKNGTVALILGNTAEDNTKYATADEAYRITTPTKTSLYGSNAAAIALAVRYGQ
jgi:hypothetical protein